MTVMPCDTFYCWNETTLCGATNHKLNFSYLLKAIETFKDLIPKYELSISNSRLFCCHSTIRRLTPTIKSLTACLHRKRYSRIIQLSVSHVDWRTHGCCSDNVLLLLRGLCRHCVRHKHVHIKTFRDEINFCSQGKFKQETSNHQA